MATYHYQAPSLPLNVPSKAPASAGLYPISRVPGSPPDISDGSTTAGSRTSAGFSYGSGSLSGDYESSSTSMSGVDVVDVLSDRMQNAFDPTPLDKGLAMQAQAYVVSIPAPRSDSASKRGTFPAMSEYPVHGQRTDNHELDLVS